MKIKPLVSVIITTKNEEKNIGNCLESISKQSYKNIEIVVVDNHSTDKTKEIVNKFSIKPLNLSFYTHGPERSAQRNFGVNKAKGEYILYLDADMIVSKNVIQDCVEKIRNNPDIIALYVSEIVMGESFWCKVRRFERSFYDGTVIDCVRFVSKIAFNKIKGFDETMSGPEDWDFDKKIRQIGKVDIIKSPIFHNESEFNLQNYLNKKSYYIKSFDSYIKKWGKDDPDIKKQFGAWYRLVGIFIEDKKWIKIATAPLLTLGIFLLRFLVGIRYLSSKLPFLNN